MKYIRGGGRRSKYLFAGIMLKKHKTVLYRLPNRYELRLSLWGAKAWTENYGFCS